MVYLQGSHCGTNNNPIIGQIHLSFVFKMDNIFNNIHKVYVMLLNKKKKLISLKYRMQKLYPPMLTSIYHKMNTYSKRTQETSRISEQVLKAL